jgi:hypothetical protein
LIRVHPEVDWSQRLQIIRGMQQAHSAELQQIETEERQGPPDLYEMFQSRLSRNLRSFPLLQRRMDCSVLFDVEGEPGGKWEVDLRKQNHQCFRPGDSGDWLIRVTIPSALLAEVLNDPGGWETLGISYKLDLYFKKGGRLKEALLNRLIYTPSPLWLFKVMLAPRFASFVVRRRDEVLKMAREKLLAVA